MTYNPYAEEEEDPFASDPFGYGAWEDPFSMDPADWGQTDPYDDPTGEYAPPDGSRSYSPQEAMQVRRQMARPASAQITDDFGNRWEMRNGRYVNTDGRADYSAPAVGGRPETQQYLQENQGWLDSQAPQRDALANSGASNGFGAPGQPGGDFGAEFSGSPMGYGEGPGDGGYGVGDPQWQPGMPPVDSLEWNDMLDPNSGAAGYAQFEDGSWAPTTDGQGPLYWEGSANDDTQQQPFFDGYQDLLPEEEENYDPETGLNAPQLPQAPEGEGPTGEIVDVLYDAAYKAGFRGEALETAVAVALAESGGQSINSNPNSDQWGSINRGPWQINNHWHPDVSDAEAMDPYAAARHAFRISNGGTDWSPWTTYKTGAYQQFLGAQPGEVGDEAEPLGQSWTDFTTGEGGVGLPPEPVPQLPTDNEIEEEAQFDEIPEPYRSMVGRQLQAGVPFAEAERRVNAGAEAAKGGLPDALVPLRGVSNVHGTPMYGVNAISGTSRPALSPATKNAIKKSGGGEGAGFGPILATRLGGGVFGTIANAFGLGKPKPKLPTQVVADFNRRNLGQQPAKITPAYRAAINKLPGVSMVNGTAMYGVNKIRPPAVSSGAARLAGFQSGTAQWNNPQQGTAGRNAQGQPIYWSGAAPGAASFAGARASTAEPRPYDNIGGLSYEQRKNAGWTGLHHSVPPNYDPRNPQHNAAWAQYDSRSKPAPPPTSPEKRAAKEAQLARPPQQKTRR